MTNVIRPQPKQEEFLSSPADIVIYLRRSSRRRQELGPAV